MLKGKNSSFFSPTHRVDLYTVGKPALAYECIQCIYDINVCFEISNVTAIFNHKKPGLFSRTRRIRVKQSLVDFGDSYRI